MLNDENWNSVRLLKITKLKKKKKQEDKGKKKAMWKRLGELTQEFKDIKEHKKSPKTVKIYT